MNDFAVNVKGPSLVLGCGSMSTHDTAGAFAVLDAFAASGGRMIDTARIYGSSEEVVGSWLQARQARGDMYLETKGAHPALSDWASRLARTEVLDDAQNSLRSLRVASVDCFVLHRDDETTQVSDIARTLSMVVGLGYADAIGVSNWSTDRVTQLISALREVGGPRVSIVSNYGGLAVPTSAAEWPGVRSATPQLLELAHLEGFQVFGWSALSSGFFTDGRRHPEFQGEENRRRRTLLESSASRAGAEPIAVLIRALATMDSLFVPVVSSRSPDRIQMLCAAAQDPALDEPAAQFLSEIATCPPVIAHW